jgi:hypothetical protein
MKSTLKRLAAVAALGTIGILAPAAGASAAATPAAPATSAATRDATGYLVGALVSGGVWGGPVAFGLGVGTGGLPVGFGQAASVTGPTVITTAPSLFVNTNNQVSAGSNLSGGQAAPL